MNGRFALYASPGCDVGDIIEAFRHGLDALPDEVFPIRSLSCLYADEAGAQSAARIARGSKNIDMTVHRRERPDDPCLVENADVVVILWDGDDAAAITHFKRAVRLRKSVSFVVRHSWISVPVATKTD